MKTEGDMRLDGRTCTRRAFIASTAAATIAGLGSLMPAGRSGIALADEQAVSAGGAQSAVADDMPVFNIPTSLPAWVDEQTAQTLLAQASDPDVASILCDAQALGELDQDLAEKLLELAADDPAARSFVAGFRTSYPGTKAGGLTEDDLPADGSIDLIAVAIITTGIAILTAPNASEPTPRPTKTPSTMVNRKIQALDKIDGITYLSSVFLLKLDMVSSCYFAPNQPLT